MSKEGQGVTQGVYDGNQRTKNAWISRTMCRCQHGTKTVLETSYQGSMLKTVSGNYAEGHQGVDPISHWCSERGNVGGTE